ncbi:galactose-1-epimerase [Vibrio sp. S9_S30]|uniref:galactose-1-epimerase n=1 Tax=Vibrio sp. S9_S30 TaxID=2720226 RepID=UPI0016807CC5|nr:galactose-1-epimerase [Vibrio sp. S9_S30]MBD1557205.1 galactose-1-epimerase [Vibrio sp. S9_S30]
MKGVARDGKPAKVITLRNQLGMTVSLMDIGATWLTCRLPLASGLRDVVLGVNNMDDFYRQSAYFGASIGRYANRIANGRFKLNGKEYQISQNQAPHSLHGGIDGFDKRRWRVEHSHNHSAVFSLISHHGDQGFPAELKVNAKYELSDDNRLIVEYSAHSDQDTVINLTNHAYFNLDGDGDILNHTLNVHADEYLPVNSEGIPDSEPLSVIGTGFDFHTAKCIKQDLLLDEGQQRVGGYDHSFILNGRRESVDDTPVSLIKACSLISSDATVALNISTNQEAIQVYSGNFLGGTLGKGKEYNIHAGIALETQCLPDSPNRNPSACRLKAGSRYVNTTSFQFNF